MEACNAAEEAAARAWNAAAEQATEAYNQAVQQATEAYNQAAEAAYEALAAAYATAVAGWMQAVLPATQTYLAALASALAAWSAAAAQAAAARDDRIQAAQQTYAQRLQDLQSQADQAWQHYASVLFDAGCAPAPDAAPQFVQFAGDPLPKPPQRWWDWIREWLWGTTSSAGAPPTVTWLDGLPDIAKIAIMKEMEKRITRMERTYGPNSKEAVYAARELEALKAGTLSRFNKDNPLPPRRPGFPPFVPAYQDLSVIRRAQCFHRKMLPHQGLHPLDARTYTRKVILFQWPRFMSRCLHVCPSLLDCYQ